MKKRLLSAVLALAMVLTLIPATVVPAFAVTYKAPGTALPSAVTKSTAADGTETKFYNKTTNAAGVVTINTVTVTRFASGADGTGREFGKWYWLDNSNTQEQQYNEITSGFIAGNNGSGLWYPDINDFTTATKITYNGVANTDAKKLRSATLTLLGSTDLDMSSGVWADTTLNVDIAGNGTLTLAENATNVTVTSKFVYGGTPTGTVAAITRNHGAYATTAPSNAALTLNATNVNVGAISLTGRANTVTLTNCVAGSITMDGTTVTARTTAGVETTSYLAQRLSTTGSQVGAVTIKGDGSTVGLASTIGGGAVSVTGNRGTLTISGASNVGAVTAASRAANNSDTANGSIPTITVSGGTVASISTAAEVGPGSASITLNRSTGNTNVGNVAVKKGAVSVAANVTVGSITVPEGSVTIAGNTAATAAIGTGATTGTLNLGSAGATTLSISGYGNDIAGITLTSGKGANLDIRSWPTGRNNDFGTLALENYAKKQIVGGTFDLNGSALPFGITQAGWISTANLLYQAKVNGKAALYNKDELGQAIDDVNGNLTDLTTDGPAATAGNIRVIGQDTTSSLTLMYGTGVLARIQFSAATPMILPSRLSSKNIVTWMLVNSTTDQVVKSFTSGQSYNIPAGTTVVNATDVSEDISKITGIASATSTTDVTGANIRATLSGNTISLSGAVGEGSGGLSSIMLNLTTDVIDTATGAPVVLTNVPVDFNPSTKATQFNDFWQGENGAITKNGQLILSNGTVYTVNGSGLAVSASNLKLAGGTYDIAVTVGGRMSSWQQPAKDELIDLLNGGSASFDINGNRAMLEAINAAQATITSTTTVTNWISTARNNVWTRGVADSTTSTGYKANMTPHSGTYANAANDNADKVAIETAFVEAYLVPYLQVNITDYDESGTLTATLTPYYRVDVSAASYNPNVAYTVQPGRALSALTGDMSTPVIVTFNLPSTFDSNYMHQDGKYVYAGSSGVWNINHAGTTGLGTIQINGLNGLIELKNPNSSGVLGAAMYYDSLQAAVDDTVPEVTATGNTTPTYSTIAIQSGFDGSGAFTMTGLARTIKVSAQGNKEVSCTSSYVDKTDLNGIDFLFQLKRDAAAVTGNVDIVVGTASNGTAAASVSKGAAGQAVTITTYPTTGYVVDTVTAKTNANANVTVTASGTNQYTFTVPAGATSVTVTPTFKVGDNKASFAVNSSSQGTAAAITGTADGRAQQGTTVPVTVSPNSGYRTVGLTARGNNGSTASVTRTGTNSFNVTVPVGATTVTVTPSFDINTGTPFADVLSNHWASSSITWAYNNKYIEGTGTYSYSPSSYMTLGEVVAMLYKAAGSPPVSGMRNPYTNLTSTSHWAYDAIIWAANQGLISSSTGTINPWGYATRAEIVEILYRRAGSPPVSGTSGFADVASNASYSKAVTWARQKGLTNGYGGNTYFRPGYAVSRAEMAAFLQRAFSNVG